MAAQLGKCQAPCLGLVKDSSLSAVFSWLGLEVPPSALLSLWVKNITSVILGDEALMCMNRAFSSQEKMSLSHPYQKHSLKRILETVVQSSWHCSMLSKDRTNKQNLKPREVDSFFLCWKVKVKSLSRVGFFVTPWSITYQSPLSMGFSRQESWSGLPFPSPGDLPKPGIEPGSPTLQADALPSEPRGIFLNWPANTFFWLSTLCLFS